MWWLFFLLSMPCRWCASSHRRTRITKRNRRKNEREEKRGENERITVTAVILIHNDERKCLIIVSVKLKFLLLKDWCSPMASFIISSLKMMFVWTAQLETRTRLISSISRSISFHLLDSYLTHAKWVRRGWESTRNRLINLQAKEIISIQSGKNLFTAQWTSSRPSKWKTSTSS